MGRERLGQGKDKEIPGREETEYPQSFGFNISSQTAAEETWTLPFLNKEELLMVLRLSSYIVKKPRLN